MKKILKVFIICILKVGFITTNLYSHPSNEFVFLVCTGNFISERHIEIDFKEKKVDSYDTKKKISNVYNIYEITKTWIRAKKNENERIIIHRYFEDTYYQTKQNDGKWNDGKSAVCDTISKKF